MGSEKHTAFAKRFTEIVESNVTLGVVRGIELAAHQELIAPCRALNQRTPHGRLTPLMWCARTCLEWIAVKAPRHGRPVGEPIEVVLDQGKGMDEVREYFRWLKKRRVPWMADYVSFASADKKARTRHAMPLQAADLIANRVKQRFVDFVADQTSGVRAPMQWLLKRGLIDARLFQRDGLAESLPALEQELETNPVAQAHYCGFAPNQRR